MELRRISVNNLFGILNYDIDLGNSENNYYYRTKWLRKNHAFKDN
ncbi:ATPase [Salmonella sp. NCTC 11881]|nr:ATPase [Salmonella sp. NCTC 11881]